MLPLPRFMKFVTVLSNGCWRWDGCKFDNGYGRFVFRGRPSLAHRVSYTLHYPLSSIVGFMVCHTCDHRWCVNPKHLYRGTNSTNQIDSYRSGTSVLHRLHKPGPDHPASKLSSSDLRQIKKLSSTTTQARLAKFFGVTQGRISQILSQS